MSKLRPVHFLAKMWISIAFLIVLLLVSVYIVYDQRQKKENSRTNGRRVLRVIYDYTEPPECNVFIIYLEKGDTLALDNATLQELDSLKYSP